MVGESRSRFPYHHNAPDMNYTTGAHRGHNTTHRSGTMPSGAHGHNGTHFNVSNPHEHHKASDSNHYHPFAHENRSITQRSAGVPGLTPDMLFIWMLFLCMLCSWISDKFGCSPEPTQTSKPRHHVLNYMAAATDLKKQPTFDEFCSQRRAETDIEEEPLLRSTFEDLQSSLHGHVRVFP